MTRVLIGCILANLTCIAVCGAILAFFPKSSGFTLTTSTVTHFFPGGVFLGAVLLCLLDFAISIFLAWSLFVSAEALAFSI